MTETPLDPDIAAYRQFEAEAAGMLGIDVGTNDPGQRLELGRATSLLVALRMMDHRQSRGEPIDPIVRNTISKELERMLPASEEEAVGYDPSLLSDDEAHLLERLLAKALGDDVALDDVPTTIRDMRESHDRTLDCLRSEREAYERQQKGYASMYTDLATARKEIAVLREELSVVRRLNAALDELVAAYVPHIPTHLRAKAPATNVVALRPTEGAA